MAQWVRFEQDGRAQLGVIDGEEIVAHEGELFDDPRPSGRRYPLQETKLLPPCRPSKIIALWNNFHQLAAKLKVAVPPEPLYLLKAVSSITAPGADVVRPPSYADRVVYEGELGIVIGRVIGNGSMREAAAAIFGYTCVNDITASDIIGRDKTFAQWARAKSFDGFGPFGPAIATELDTDRLHVRTELNGEERQNYPLNDMIFPPALLVSLLSRDMTLVPGDLICCGTSLGVGSMKEPVNRISVTIDGIGTLTNRFLQ